MGAFRPLPNASKFQICLSKFDVLFAMFGIRKRFAPKLDFELYKNHGLNRFLDRMLIKLCKYRDEGNAEAY